MKILFSGTSSFTGYWFIQELVRHGHSIIAICQKSQNEYQGIRQRRIQMLSSLCDIHFNCSLGSPEFFQTIQEESFDLFCHHAAETTDYKSPTFDYIHALERNTYQLSTALQFLQKKGCNRIILSGSVFENGEGGDPASRAVSAYGLSKGLTYQVFKYFTEILGINLGKFVIPHPFGPYEDARLTSWMLESWLGGKTPIVNTPSYIRDFIHVDLLAQNYRMFAESLSSSIGIYFCKPSGYVESVSQFIHRLAQEMNSRLLIPCNYQLKEQNEWLEPVSRYNTEPAKTSEWNEGKAWDLLAQYYQNIRGST